MTPHTPLCPHRALCSCARSYAKTDRVAGCVSCEKRPPYEPKGPWQCTSCVLYRMADGTRTHMALTADNRCPCNVDAGSAIDLSALTAASKNSSLSKDLRAAAKKSAKQIAKQF